ncbi:hypothetical protein HY635_01525 [Candidatus Uhrbacteria bacterium]|nr:hypothetical protein [Candidatus Uhrbacteria bacterium]
MVMLSGDAGVTPKTLFSRATSDRLDRVRRYLGEPGGAPKPRIRGRASTKAALAELGLVDRTAWPRNRPAYEVIARSFPGFDWRRGGQGDRVWVTFTEYPTVEGETPSLADLSVESLRTTVAPEAPSHIQVDLFAPNIQQRLRPLLDMRRADDARQRDPRGATLVRALVDLGIAYPPLQVVDAVRAWWERVLAGEPATVVVAVCPDYSTRETGDPERPVAYTFDGLNGGIGHVARRALGALPKLWECFRANGAGHVQFVVAMADCEADVAENCRRVGVRREEFLQRLRESQQAFAAACPPGMPVATPLLTELDRAAWDDLLAQARAAVAVRKYGPLGLTEDDLGIIARARRSLYERWYGGTVDARAVLDGQVPEYLAAGDLLRQCFPNALMLGTDAVPMAPFAQGLGTTIQPVLYLRGVEY